MRRSARLAWLAVLCAVLPAAPPAADEVVIASLPVGECTLRVEVRTQEPHVLQVRTLHPRYLPCAIDQTALAAVLEQALTGPAAQPRSAPYSAISLGRLVEHPWLSTYLARSAAGDPRWNVRTGKPVREDLNHYVAAQLSRPEVVGPLQPALAAGGYRIARATAEKVLVAPAREIPGLDGDHLSERLPFDAILWFRLQAR